MLLQVSGGGGGGYRYWAWARIFKRLGSPVIDSKESIPHQMMHKMQNASKKHNLLYIERKNLHLF
jgi:hypothetical protein